MSVELYDQAAAVALAQLPGDDPRLELEVVEHVTGAEVAELGEVQMVVWVTARRSQMV